jgi:hypothetical protein
MSCASHQRQNPAPSRGAKLRRPVRGMRLHQLKQTALDGQEPEQIPLVSQYRLFRSDYKCPIRAPHAAANLTKSKTEVVTRASPLPISQEHRQKPPRHSRPLPETMNTNRGIPPTGGDRKVTSVRDRTAARAAHPQPVPKAVPSCPQNQTTQTQARPVPLAATRPNTKGDSKKLASQLRLILTG